MNNLHHQRIEKEELSHYVFSQKEKVSSTFNHSDLSKELLNACKLGNSSKGKVRIQFLTTEGIKEVFTTIWGVSENYVALKNGSTIPVSSILQVRY